MTFVFYFTRFVNPLCLCQDVSTSWDLGGGNHTIKKSKSSQEQGGRWASWLPGGRSCLWACWSPPRQQSSREERHHWSSQLLSQCAAGSLIALIHMWAGRFLNQQFRIKISLVAISGLEMSCWVKIHEEAKRLQWPKATESEEAAVPQTHNQFFC